MLLQANDLSRQTSGIFIKEGYGSIASPGGVDNERYLADVLLAATDMSSTSAELERKIRDWPSEYHLSSKRANLMRGLNLTRGSRVLEVGCGCGAITRYLGEQGCEVDAIESSQGRAELTALRCRGLAKVNIVCANFNELNIPTGAYDVVLLVGVIDYAARVWPGNTDDEEAVVRLLSAARASLGKNGVIIIGTQNRTGLKYVLGAHEDHYAQRYVGIHGYPESASVKTYTQGEWATLISRSGIPGVKYLFPFPDYKVPTVLLSENYALHNQNGYTHIEGVASRDYSMILDLGVHEPMFWQSASANGTFGAFANSFLIVMGDNPSVLNEIADVDFVHLPSFKRKRQYSVITKKRTASDLVERQRVDGGYHTLTSGLIQHLRNEPYFEGNLLSVIWSRSLLIDPWAGGFRQYLLRYYEYLRQQPLNIDLVPTNIIVSTAGDYRHFDLEWEVEYALDPEYVLFRALMLFAFRHKAVLREFARRYSLHTIRDFIHYGFGVLGIDGLGRVNRYSGQEENFQNLVNETDASGSVEELLALRLDQEDRPSPIYARVYWKQSGQEYNEESSVEVKSIPDREVARLTFSLPGEIVNISHLRFDPCDERRMDDVGFLQIPYLRIDGKLDGTVKRLLELKGSEAVAQAGKLSGIVFNKARYGEVFAVVGDNPEIEYSLGDAEGTGSWGSYTVEVQWSHIRSPEYRLVRDGFLAREKTLCNALDEQKIVNAKLEQEIREIKSSRWWKAAERYRSLKSRSPAGTK